MKPVSDKIHRILALRLVVTIGTVSKDGRQNIIPINNITSISTEPSMVIIAVYKPWITAENLKTAEAFNETVKRHKTREKSNHFSVEEMKDWYSMAQPLGLVTEQIIHENMSKSEIIELIRTKSLYS